MQSWPPDVPDAGYQIKIDLIYMSSVSPPNFKCMWQVNTCQIISQVSSSLTKDLTTYTALTVNIFGFL